jgi:peptidoglycan/LPS O-acetylase OafA/YrhL
LESARHQPALDGIRAFAVLAVLAFHAGARWMPGGFLGVDVFFVLSGFLITGILTREPAVPPSLPTFFRRRARRLLPALIAMLLVSVTAAATFMKDVAASTAADLPWALLGLSNWWYVFHHQPYFEAMGRPPLFRHTWSLGVEAQFYLIWPLLVRYALRVFGMDGVRRLAMVCAALSAAALLFVGLTTSPATEISRAYFGTDTHAFGLFLGAALATSKWRHGIGSSNYVSVVGIFALAGLVALFRLADETRALYFSLPLASVLAVFLVGAAANSRTAIAQGLAFRPLTWLGERSYSIYVWHWPIFQATRPGIDVVTEGIPNLLLRLALTLAVAEASYRLIETPFRNGILRSIGLAASGWAPKLYGFGLTAGIAAAALLVTGEVALVRHGIETAPRTTAIIPVAPKPQTQVATPIPAAAAKPATAPAFHVTGTPAADRPEILKLPTVLLGDSVLLGVSQWLSAEMNVIKVDAVVGRQATEVRRLAEALALEVPLPEVVVLDLGNNGTIDEATFRATLHALRGCRKVVVVNARVPRKWQDDGDDLMARLIPDYPNAVLADWRAASAGHPEYLNADGVHANVTGAKVYTALVVKALTEATPAPLPVNP